MAARSCHQRSTRHTTGRDSHDRPRGAASGSQRAATIADPRVIQEVAVETARTARAVRKILGSAVIDHRVRDEQHHHPLPNDAARTIGEIASEALPAAHIIVELEGWAFGLDSPATAEELWKYNNATPEVQTAAAQHAPSNDEEGLAAVLVRLR